MSSMVTWVCIRVSPKAYRKGGGGGGGGRKSQECDQIKELYALSSKSTSRDRVSLI